MIPDLSGAETTHPGGPGLAAPLGVARLQDAGTVLAPWSPDTLGRLGSLEVRLARTPKEVRRAQRLRYRVFYEEGGAAATSAMRLARRDADPFDRICDHLVVLDHADRPRPFRKPKPKVVGTYRLLGRRVADAHGGFYSAGEFELEPLLRAHPNVNILEVGRSCVLRSHRSRRTVDLLWQGIGAYVAATGTDVLIGCASFPGTSVRALAAPLSFLHQRAAAQPAWRAYGRHGRGVSTELLGPDDYSEKEALKALPPLVRAYLRLGATFGPEAVVDHAFGTVDLLVVLPIASIAARYVERFGAPAALAA